MRSNCTFDQTYYGETLVKELELVCDRKYLISLTQTFYLVGTVCAVFTGYISDRYGRKKSVILLVSALTVTLFITQLLLLKEINMSMTSRYVIYTGAQVLSGIFSYALYYCCYVLHLESTTKTTLFTNIYLSIYVLGKLLLWNIKPKTLEHLPIF